MFKFLRKNRSTRPLPFGTARKESGPPPIALPRQRKTKGKDCLVIRYGALGDAVWMTPVLRQLKADGWHVTYNCTPYSAQVLQHCPWIDEFLLQEKDAIPNDDLEGYWETLGANFDKVINMSGSIEGALLKTEGTEEYDWPSARRRRECNGNYMDATCAAAGFPNLKGARPELHFTEHEEAMAQHFRNSQRDKFLILWSLCGSSFHKAWPWTFQVVEKLWRQDRANEIRIVTVGDELTQMIEPRYPDISIPKAGICTVRQSMLFCKYADLVIGPETGILNAASCYDTHKIVLLSHSSEQNLTKYWTNTTALHPENCPCHPCHQLHYSRPSCPSGPEKATLCCENLSPDRVHNAIKKIYERWKHDSRIRSESALRARQSAVA